MGKHGRFDEGLLLCEVLRGATIGLDFGGYDTEGLLEALNDINDLLLVERV